MDRSSYNAKKYYSLEYNTPNLTVNVADHYKTIKNIFKNCSHISNAHEDKLSIYLIQQTIVNYLGRIVDVISKKKL